MRGTLRLSILRTTTGLFCAILLSSCASPSVEPSKEERLGDLHVQSGLADIHEGRFADAIRSLLQATKLTPKDPKAWDALGIAYFGRKETRKSEEAFRKALQMDPTYSQARLNLAAMLIEVRRYAEARKELELVKQDSTFNMRDKVYFNLAIIDLNQNNLDRAEKAFALAAGENKTNCLAWLKLAETRAKLGRTASSFEAYRNASSGLCYSFPEAHFAFGAALAENEEFDSARKKLTEVSERFPNTSWARMAREKLKTISAQ